MYTGLIASRYASALAEFSAANGDEERTYDEVRRLIGLYRRDRSLRDVLFSPVVGDEAKLEVLRGAFGRPMSASLEGFVRLVLRHRREHYLYFMFYSFTDLYRRRHNIREALLVTAAPVDDRFAERVCRAAESRTHGEVRLAREVRPDLIGGFVFRMDDVLIDASVAAQLKLLRRKLGCKPNRIV